MSHIPTFPLLSTIASSVVFLLHLIGSQMVAQLSVQPPSLEDWPLLRLLKKWHRNLQ